MISKDNANSVPNCWTGGLNDKDDHWTFHNLVNENYATDQEIYNKSYDELDLRGNDQAGIKNANTFFVNLRLNDPINLTGVKRVYGSVHAEEGMKEQYIDTGFIFSDSSTQTGHISADNTYASQMDSKNKLTSNFPGWVLKNSTIGPDFDSNWMKNRNVLAATCDLTSYVKYNGKWGNDNTKYLFLNAGGHEASNGYDVKVHYGNSDKVCAFDSIDPEAKNIETIPLTMELRQYYLNLVETRTVGYMKGDGLIGNIEANIAGKNRGNVDSDHWNCTLYRDEEVGVSYTDLAGNNGLRTMGYAIAINTEKLESTKTTDENDNASDAYRNGTYKVFIPSETQVEDDGSLLPEAETVVKAFMDENANCSDYTILSEENPTLYWELVNKQNFVVTPELIQYLQETYQADMNTIEVMPAIINQEFDVQFQTVINDKDAAPDGAIEVKHTVDTTEKQEYKLYDRTGADAQLIGTYWWSEENRNVGSKITIYQEKNKDYTGEWGAMYLEMRQAPTSQEVGGTPGDLMDQREMITTVTNSILWLQPHVKPTLNIQLNDVALDYEEEKTEYPYPKDQTKLLPEKYFAQSSIAQRLIYRYYKTFNESTGELGEEMATPPAEQGTYYVQAGLEDYVIPYNHSKSNVAKLQVRISYSTSGETKQAITYGQSLKNAELKVTAIDATESDVAGSARWVNEDLYPNLIGDSYQAEYVFTPVDTHYPEKTGTCKVSVQKAIPQIALPEEEQGMTEAYTGSAIAYEGATITGVNVPGLCQPVEPLVYQYSSDNGKTYSDQAPTEPGKYLVKVSYPGDAYYANREETTKLTITPIEGHIIAAHSMQTVTGGSEALASVTLKANIGVTGNPTLSGKIKFTYWVKGNPDSAISSGEIVLDDKESAEYTIQSSALNGATEYEYKAEYISTENEKGWLSIAPSEIGSFDVAKVAKSQGTVVFSKSKTDTTSATNFTCEFGKSFTFYTKVKDASDNDVTQGANIKSPQTETSRLHVKKAADGTVYQAFTISPESAGTYQFMAISPDFESKGIYYAPVYGVVTITVEKADPGLQFQPESTTEDAPALLSYTGEPAMYQAVPTVKAYEIEGKTSTGAITYEYYQKKDTGYEKMAAGAFPKDAEYYRIDASIAETKNFTADTDSLYLQIEPSPISGHLDDVTKTYGDTYDKSDFKATFTENGTGQDVSQHIAYELKYYTDQACTNTLENAPVDAGTYYVKPEIVRTNYNLDTQQNSATLKVEPKMLTVSIEKKKKTYDKQRFTVKDGDYSIEGLNSLPKTDQTAIRDGIAFLYRAEEAEYWMTDGPKDAGTYDIMAKADIEGTTNYKLVTETLGEIVIQPCKILFDLQDERVTYDGNGHQVNVDHIRVETGSEYVLTPEEVSAIQKAMSYKFYRKISGNNGDKEVQIQKIINAGDYVEKASLANMGISRNFTADEVSCSVTIEKKKATITLEDHKTYVKVIFDGVLGRPNGTVRFSYSKLGLIYQPLGTEQGIEEEIVMQDDQESGSYVSKLYMEKGTEYTDILVKAAYQDSLLENYAIDEVTKRVDYLGNPNDVQPDEDDSDGEHPNDNNSDDNKATDDSKNGGNHLAGDSTEAAATGDYTSINLWIVFILISLVAGTSCIIAKRKH
ncbi:MAG: hypothetical protein PHW47_00140 [Lachnospira sp.]|nr:hypothetical protein [Lachnospira sp.]